MIILKVGNVGSGKTLTSVMDIARNPQRVYLSNIQTPKLKNNHLLTDDMKFKRILIKTKKDGTEVFKTVLNEEFWRDWVKKNPCTHIILDEGQRDMNSRRSGSSINIAMGDFLALIRRIVGDSSTYQGSLTILTQLDYRVDIIGRDMSNRVVFCRGHYDKGCLACGYSWYENSDHPEPLWECPRCGGMKVKKFNYRVEQISFLNVNDYMLYRYRGMKTWYKPREEINGVDRFFGAYESLQWDQMRSIY